MSDNRCEIIEKIAGSAKEQTLGIDQVNVAVTQMDQMTQQNAALVEQATAASKSTAEQAKQMSEQMTFFTINGIAHESASSVDNTVKSGSSMRKGAAASPVSIQTKNVKSFPKAINSDDIQWQEF